MEVKLFFSFYGFVKNNSFIYTNEPLGLGASRRINLSQELISLYLWYKCGFCFSISGINAVFVPPSLYTTIEF